MNRDSFLSQLAQQVRSHPRLASRDAVAQKDRSYHRKWMSISFFSLIVMSLRFEYGSLSCPIYFYIDHPSGKKFGCF